MEKEKKIKANPKCKNGQRRKSYEGNQEEEARELTDFPASKEKEHFNSFKRRAVFKRHAGQKLEGAAESKENFLKTRVFVYSNANGRSSGQGEA